MLLMTPNLCGLSNNWPVTTSEQKQWLTICSAFIRSAFMSYQGADVFVLMAILFCLQKAPGC